MTVDNLGYNNDQKLSLIKKIVTRVADGLVAKNENVTKNLDVENINFIVDSCIKNVVEKEIK